MRSIKPGRGPSAMGAVGGIIAIVVGVLWTIFVYSITRDAPKPVATFFPLFGILFVIIGIINVFYNIHNTLNKDRFSVFDITSSSEETDPLNQAFGNTQIRNSASDSVESKLNELQTLKDKKLISDAEYVSQRQRILDSI